MILRNPSNSSFLNGHALSLIAFKVVASLALVSSEACADSFGGGINQFDIQFVTIGNPGNPDDAGAGGGSSSAPYGGVAYPYRIAMYEVSQIMFDKAAASGMSNVTAGPWAGNQPAANVSWYEAAAFVNFLNTSQGSHAAYDLTFSNGWTMNLWGPPDQASTGVDSGTNPYRHRNAFYFIPGESEWYKSAYHKNDGATANFWDYPTGGNTAPDGIDFAADLGFEAVINDGFQLPAPKPTQDVGNPSAHGTYGQGGNVEEHNESAFDGTNDSSSEMRVWRGGAWTGSAGFLLPSFRSPTGPSSQFGNVGFRVASLLGPTLHIEQTSSNTVTIWWEPNLDGTVLQESLTQSPTTWTNSPSGTTNPAEVSVDSAAKLFRVVRP